MAGGSLRVSRQHNMIAFNFGVLSDHTGGEGGGNAPNATHGSKLNFNYKKADWTKMRQIFLAPSDVTVGDDVDRKAREVVSALRAAVRHSVPMVRSTAHDKPKGWSPLLLNLRAEVRKARRRYQRTRDKELRQRALADYRTVKERFKFELREQRLKSWESFVEANLVVDAWGLPYKLVTEKVKSPQMLSTLVREDGSMTTGWRESAEVLLNGLLPADSEESESEAQQALRRAMSELNDLAGIVMPFAIEEVRAAILQQKKHKAAGPDGLKAEVLHHLVGELSPFLCKLFNECLLQGRIPNCFKVANIVVLSKGDNKDPKMIKSYRPICLLNVIGKVQERLLSKRLREHRLMHGISNKQYGFRKGKSTQDAINFALGIVHNSNSKYMIGIFIDIAGAFDNLWWPFLFSCLQEMDCPRSLYLSLLDYRKGREVRIPDWEMDIKRSISKGCPQGSIFGPEFWDVIFDPLLKLLEREATVKVATAYVDDLLLMMEGDTRYELETKSCRAMEVVDYWCRTAKLKIAANKTSYQLMKGSLMRDPIIRLGNDSIVRSVTTKYLGVNLDEAAKFMTHAETVCERGEKAMMRVARLGQGEFRLPLDIVRLNHNALLVSIVG